jgi:hypothetical protein
VRALVVGQAEGVKVLGAPGEGQNKDEQPPKKQDFGFSILDFGLFRQLGQYPLAY